MCSFIYEILKLYFCAFVVDMILVRFYNTSFSVPIGLYGFQHYLSILGSIILIPLVIVPAMGGTYVSSLTHKVMILCCMFVWRLVQMLDCLI